MSAKQPGPPGSALSHQPSHRTIVALTTCVITALSNGASMPYLTRSAPEPIRLVTPPMAAIPPSLADAAKEAVEHDAGVEAASTPPQSEAAAAPSAAGAGGNTAAAAPGTAAPDSGSTPKPKFELVPDTVRPRPGARLEDILPFFVPPAPPASRATYEQK